MNGPERKGKAPVEATQELQALDVLEIVETLKPKLAAGARRPSPSNSSIAPVGLDLAPGADKGEEEANPTMEVRLPVRRRRLGAIVIGAVSCCGLILLAAVIARVGHASSESSTASASSTAPAATAASSPAGTMTTVAEPSPAPPSATAVAPSSATGSGASTGTVRLDKPAVAGRVWLDGKKLSSSSALVSCGTHQIKVGRGRTHSIDVPCGGELGVSR